MGDGIDKGSSPGSDVGMRDNNSVKVVNLIYLGKDLWILHGWNKSFLKKFRWKSFRAIVYKKLMLGIKVIDGKT